MCSWLSIVYSYDKYVVICVQVHANHGCIYYTVYRYKRAVDHLAHLTPTPSSTTTATTHTPVIITTPTAYHAPYTEEGIYNLTRLASPTSTRPKPNSSNSMAVYGSKVVILAAVMNIISLIFRGQWSKKRAAPAWNR